MSRRSSGWSRSFRNDPELQEYFLEGVILRGNTLGTGSYGSVIEVEYKQIICAAKSLHKLLLEANNDGVENIITKYQQECKLMSGLRHPNITQFLGLCILEDYDVPLLVMERLEMSVDDLLECSPSVPLPVKASILYDTCCGLTYLHNMESPIFHRDLTARNVLLTTSMSAKITDLGNSRIVTFKPGQLAQTLTNTPGTAVYMPPEALNDTAKYGASLDMFSYGHLALYTLTKVFPETLLAATYPDPNRSGQLLARNEVERRDEYIKILEREFNTTYPSLVQLVRDCLDNEPTKRPSSDIVIEILQPVREEIKKKHGGNLSKMLSITNVLLVKELKAKDKRIEELERAERERDQLTTENDRLKSELDALRRQLQRNNS